MRRRGYTPAAIRNFCHTIGITKFNGFTDVALLEYSVREDLNANAPRRMAVLNPLKVTITTVSYTHIDVYKRQSQASI